MVLKIISYNMYKGRKFISNRYIIEKMSSALHFLNPDIMMIQEFPGSNPLKSENNIEPVKHLGANVFPYSVYGMNAESLKGNHGNIIFSKFPIVGSDNINISESRFAKRGLLHAQIEISEAYSPLHLLCSHLDLLAKDRRKQVKKILGRIKEVIPPHESLILGGDFNDWSGKLDKTIFEGLHLDDQVSLRSKKKLLKTYPSILPVLPLDRFYHRGVEVLEKEVLRGKPWNQLSDHLPLVLRCELPKN